VALACSGASRPTAAASIIVVAIVIVIVIVTIIINVIVIRALEPFGVAVEMHNLNGDAVRRIRKHNFKGTD
jgi:type IV secretory pathway component VirB8